MHTLLVSSDHKYKQLFERILRSRGHRVLSCHSIRAAWRVHVAQRPALILVVAGGEEVFEFCRRVNTAEEQGPSPTVAMAAPQPLYEKVPDDLIVFPLEGMHNIQSGISAAEQQAFQLRE